MDGSDGADVSGVGGCEMKYRIASYTFDASAKTITFSPAISLKGLLVITNVTDGVIIYNFADPALGGVMPAGVLTLDYDTSAMSDSDDLQIWYDDAVASVAVTAAALPLPSGAATATLQGGGLPAALGAGGGVKIDGSGTAVPVSGTVAVTNANLDVALSTRTKPADQQHAIIDSGSCAVTGTVGVTNLDVALSTRTKPADQQHVIIDSSAAVAVTNANLDVATSTRAAEGVAPSANDSGRLIERQSIAFAAGDTKTTEKFVTFTAPATAVHPDSVYKLVVDKPAYDALGNCTITLYDSCLVDGTNSRSCTLAILTAELVTGAATYRSYLVQGAFIGGGPAAAPTLVVGAKFAVTGGSAITVYFALYRV